MKALATLKLIFLRYLRPFRGGIDFRSRMAKDLESFYPNSGNWQAMAKQVFSGVQDLPAQLLGLSSLQSVPPGKVPRFDPKLDSPSAGKLAKLFETHGSDKEKSGYSLLYGSIMDKALAQTSRRVNVLEIGIGSQDPNIASTMAWANSKAGGSLRAFAELSPLIDVLGLDFDRKTLFSEDRISTLWADQMSPESLMDVTRSFQGRKFDLIIDDGLHFIGANLNSLIALLPHLADGGVFVVEDIPARSELLWEVVNRFIPEGFDCSYYRATGGGFNFVIQKL